MIQSTTFCWTFSAAGSQTWTADQDYDVSSCMKTNTTGAAMITTDPNLALTDLSAPATNQLLRDVIFLVAAGASGVNNIRAFIPSGTKLRIVAGNQMSLAVTMSYGSAEETPFLVADLSRDRGTWV
jgi:hypothetical protein